MYDIKMPKEGDLYKTVNVGEHIFELRYGYYEAFERTRGEPVVIYPDLKSIKLYDSDGFRIVTAVQDSCKHYSVPEGRDGELSCGDCVFYPESNKDIGICLCNETRRGQ